MTYVRTLPVGKKSAFVFKDYLDSVKAKLEALVNKVYPEHLPELMSLVREVLAINHIKQLGRLQEIDKMISNRAWRYR